MRQVVGNLTLLLAAEVTILWKSAAKSLLKVRVSGTVAMLLETRTMDRAEVLATCRYLSDVDQWPRIPEDSRPEQWLSNFEDDEMAHALALLDSFVYFNERQTKRMFESVFHSLSAEVCADTPGYAAKKAVWNEFVTGLIVTHPTGERPGPSDSGYRFHVMARSLLGLRETQLVEPIDAIRQLTYQPCRAVVIFDDFVGSGDQFLATWAREYDAYGRGIAPESLGKAVAAANVDVIYMTLVATSTAIDRISETVPEVKVRAAHVLPEEYSAMHPDSVILPNHLRGSAREIIEKSSARGGIQPENVFGHDNLGLAIALGDSVPDANLGLFWDRNPNWHALIPKA